MVMIPEERVRQARAKVKGLEARVEGLKGDLSNAIKELRRAEFALADSKLPTVYWLDYGEPCEDRASRWVVRKVTTERIFVAREGEERMIQYNRTDGSALSSMMRFSIHLARTFPEE